MLFNGFFYEEMLYAPLKIVLRCLPEGANGINFHFGTLLRERVGEQVIARLFVETSNIVNKGTRHVLTKVLPLGYWKVGNNYFLY